MNNKIKAAFEAAKGNEQMTAILVALFGNQKPEPKADNRPITERVKTFEDAVRELGDNHPLVNMFDTITNEHGEADNDLIAYLKLRIIVAALNEGWTPQFTEDEWRHFPWLALWTKEEYEDLSAERKARCRRVVYRSNYSAYAGGGVSCADASYDSSNSYACLGSRLAFRSEKLAIYAGNQFMDIYAEWMGIELEKEEA